jgi:hypothetical protein
MKGVNKAKRMRLTTDLGNEHVHAAHVVVRHVHHLLVERRGVGRVRRRVVKARVLEVVRRQALGGLDSGLDRA